jgi:CRP/FNR family transcriptional regulator
MNFPSTATRTVPADRYRCNGCLSRRQGFCKALDLCVRAELKRPSRQHLLAAGESVCFNKGGQRSAFMVGSGLLKLYKPLRDGRCQIVRLLHPGDFLDEATGSAGARITAISDSELCLFSAEDYEGLRQERPDVLMRQLEATQRELRKAHNRLLQLGRLGAIERVATFLLDSAERCREAGWGAAEFEIQLPRVDIADYLGLTTETVSRALSRLKRSGWIEMPRATSFLLVDELQLAELAAGKRSLDV